MSVNTPPENIGNEPTLELMAGRHPNGEVIVEKVLVNPQPQEQHYLLLKSPLFVRGIARGDLLRLVPATRGGFEVAQHGGNLCLRVFSRHGFASPELEALEQTITSGIEKLGGDQDIKEANALVYSIHVSSGFNAIEQLMDESLAAYQDVAWYYGNVYDPESGEPLNWWQAILSPE